MSEPKVRPRTQAERREEAETRLVNAALRLVAERGYGDFTLADVGERAGYSRGLPAHYFKRKEDLLALVAQHAVDAYYASVARELPSEPGLPRVREMIRSYVKGPTRIGNRAMSILVAEAIVRPSLKETISRLNRKGLAALRRELEAGIETGTIRADCDAETEAKVIFAFLRGQISFAALDPGFDAETVAEAFIAMLESRLRPDGN